MATATQLSKNDSAIIGMLFESEAMPTAYSEVAKPSHPNYDEQTLLTIKRIEHEALESIDEAHPGVYKLESAIAMIDKIIEVYPKYSSAYNNRAQLRRMFYEHEHLLDQPDTVNAILDDLSRAISLASPKQDGVTTGPSDLRVLSAAYTHRASLFYQASRSEKSATSFHLIKQMSGLSSEQLEEEASRDFALGGRYGNKMAKHLAVKTNPYAKMCASIVNRAMSSENGNL